MTSLYHFNHQVLVTLSNVFSVLDKMAPYSRPLTLAATNATVSSQAVARHNSGVWDALSSTQAKARAWFENGLDIGPRFEQRLMYEPGSSTLCDQDDLNLRLTCYRPPQPIQRLVRSLDLYQPEARAVAVFSHTPSLLTCLAYEDSYRHCSNTCSVDVFGRGKQVLTTIGRIVLVRLYSLRMSSVCSGSNVVCSLVTYRHGAKTLAVYGCTPLRWVYLSGLLARLYSGVVLPVFCRARFTLVSAFVAVCVLIMEILVRRGLAVADMASDPVHVSFQLAYKLVLDDAGNTQDEEPERWSFTRIPLDTTYNGYERDQDLDDDVLGICGSDSHDVDSVASGTVTVTSFGISDSDLTDTLSVDPVSTPLPCSEGDDIVLAGEVTQPTTNAYSTKDATVMSRAIDATSIPLSPDDGLWDIDAEFDAVSDSGSHGASLLSADMDSNDTLADDVGEEEPSGYRSLTLSEGWSAKFNSASGILIVGGDNASTLASMSLNSEILGELGNAEQERPTGDGDGNVTVSVDIIINANDTGASTATSEDTVTPGLDTPPTGSTGTSELSTKDSLDLSLDINSGNRLLDIDLDALGGSISELVPDVNRNEKMAACKPNAPPARTTSAPELPTQDSVDLNPMETWSQLLDIDLGELGGSLSDFMPDADGKEDDASSEVDTPTGTAGPSEDLTEDSVNLNLAMATRTRLLDVDLNGLESTVSGFVLDVNGEANDSASKSTETVGIFELPTKSSLDLGLDISAQSQLMDVNLKELDKYADDSVDEGSRRHGPRTGAVEAEPPTEDTLELNLDMDTGADFWTSTLTPWGTRCPTSI
ncbi:hypothetical protein FS749_003068 [Ceratobasidium sp. UAMH 11750]|nr:hypothetical protein FS749_003068 [Ceratobasidium sp. UAMH 11750]